MFNFSEYLDNISTCLESHTDESIENIRKLTDDFILGNGLDKKQLICKWVSINGENTFNVLKTDNVSDFFKTLVIVFLGSLSYINKLNDPLYLVSQISIMSDWYKFSGLNLEEVENE